MLLEHEGQGGLAGDETEKAGQGELLHGLVKYMKGTELHPMGRDVMQYDQVPGERSHRGNNHNNDDDNY